MKRRILYLINKYGLQIEDYKSYRSDIGCQVFECRILFDNDFDNYADSYFVGDPNGQDVLINDFEKHLKKLTNDR